MTNTTLDTNMQVKVPVVDLDVQTASAVIDLLSAAKRISIKAGEMYMFDDDGMCGPSMITIRGLENQDDPEIWASRFEIDMYVSPEA